MLFVAQQAGDGVPACPFDVRGMVDDRGPDLFDDLGGVVERVCVGIRIADGVEDERRACDLERNALFLSAEQNGLYGRLFEKRVLENLDVPFVDDGAFVDT
ncbi:hypothetical protein, partial [Hydrogenimonas sp.]